MKITPKRHVQNDLNSLSFLALNIGNNLLTTEGVALVQYLRFFFCGLFYFDAHYSTNNIKSTTAIITIVKCASLCLS